MKHYADSNIGDLVLDDVRKKALVKLITDLTYYANKELSLGDTITRARIVATLGIDHDLRLPGYAEALICLTVNNEEI